MAVLAVSYGDAGPEFSFLVDGSTAGVPVSLLVVVGSTGETLWLIAGLPAAEPSAGVSLASGHSEAQPLRRLAYDAVPPGFEQLVPEGQPPPALRPGQYRVFFAGTTSGSTGFTVA